MENFLNPRRPSLAKSNPFMASRAPPSRDRSPIQSGIFSKISQYQITNNNNSSTINNYSFNRYSHQGHYDKKAQSPTPHIQILLEPPVDGRLDLSSSNDDESNERQRGMNNTNLNKSGGLNSTSMGGKYEEIIKGSINMSKNQIRRLLEDDHDLHQQLPSLGGNNHPLPSFYNNSSTRTKGFGHTAGQFIQTNNSNQMKLRTTGQNTPQRGKFSEFSANKQDSLTKTAGGSYARAMKSEGRVVVHTNAEHKDLLLPILSKMRFVKAQYRDDQLHKQTGDFSFVLEKQDLLGHDYQPSNTDYKSPKRSSMTLPDNPKYLMKKVQEYSDVIEQRIKKKQNKELQKLEQRNFLQVKASINNNVIQVTQSQMPQLRSTSQDRIIPKNSNNQLAKKIIDRQKLSKSKLSQDYQVDTDQFNLVKNMNTENSQDNRKETLIHQLEEVEIQDKLLSHQFDMKSIGSDDNDNQDYSPMPDLLKVNNRYGPKSVLKNTSLKSSLERIRETQNLSSFNDSPSKIASYSIADGINKKYRVNTLGRQLVTSMVQEQLSASKIAAAILMRHTNEKTLALRQSQDSRKTVLYSQGSNAQVPLIHHHRNKFQLNHMNQPSKGLSSADEEQPRIMSPQSNTSQENIFARVQNKDKFFQEIKDYKNQINNNKANENIEFFKNCIQQNIVPMPVLSKLEKQILSLINYPLSEGLALSIGKTLDALAQREPKKQVKDLFLENNNLKDATFATILRGLVNHQPLKKIHYSNNELGQQSLEPLLQILSKPKPRNIEELSLNKVKAPSVVIETIIQQVTLFPYIQRIKLTGMNLNDIKIVRNIASIMRNNYSLIELDLSWSSLLPMCNLNISLIIELDLLGKELEDNTRLQYLNLSWNTLEENSQYSHSFIEKLSYFIQMNKNLLHLDLSGMQLKNFVVGIIEAISKSQSLLAVHLTNNYISLEMKKKVLQQLKIIAPKSFLIEHDQQLLNETNQGINKHPTLIGNTPHEKDNKTIKNSSIQITLDSQAGIQDDEETLMQMQEAKLINTHVMNVINTSKLQNKNKFNGDRTLESQLEQPFVINRHVDHKELIWNMAYEQSKSNIKNNLFSSQFASRWRVTNNHECYVCQKWKYAVIFYKQTQATHHYSLLNMEKVSPIEHKNNTILPLIESDLRPAITGGWANWKYLQMLKIHEFAMLLDPRFKMEHLENNSQLGEHEILKALDLEDSILSDYKLKWRQKLQQHLKFQSGNNADIIFINYPKENDLAYDDKIGADMYVFAGFMKPGKHQLIIKDPEFKCFFGKQFAVDLRTQELEVNIIQKKSRRVVTTRVFKKETSVFKDWREDTQQMIKKMFEFDLGCWKVPRFVKNQEDYKLCIQKVQECYESIKKAFTYFSCLSTYPSISMLDFSNLCNECQMLDKNLNIAALDRLFIATNVELVDMDENPDKELCRFELLEIMVRIAGCKYKDAKQTETYWEGVERLMKEHFLPKCEGIEWQEFRDQQLWCLDVSDTYEVNLTPLQKIFNQFSKKNKGFLHIKEAQNIAKAAGLEISEKDVKFCYGMSKMSILNEAKDSKNYQKMVFVEFLEFIARMSEYIYKKDEYQQLPLYEKTNMVLESLLAMVGVQRKIPEFNEEFDVQDYNEQ